MNKADILKALDGLPESATVEDAMDRLYLLYKIEQGMGQSEAGNTIAHDELKKQIDTWGE